MSPGFWEKLVGGSSRQEDAGSRRQEIPEDRVPESRTIDGGAVQTLKEPGGFRIRLVCSMKHVNWVSRIPKPVVRIGSSRSKIRYVRCLRCGEVLIGGELLVK